MPWYMKCAVLLVAELLLNCTLTIILSVVAIAMSAPFTQLRESRWAVALLVAVIVSGSLVPCSVITPAVVIDLAANFAVTTVPPPVLDTQNIPDIVHNPAGIAAVPGTSDTVQ